MDAASDRRARMQERMYSSFAEEQQADRAYWAALPAATRVLEVWALSEEQWRLRGQFPDEPGFVDLLRAFIAHDVRFLIVGAYALGVHGRPRATGDLDVWVAATAENATRVMRALAEFGAPLTSVSAADFSRPGVVFQMGLPPRRIDVLTQLTGLTFDDAWPTRLHAPFGPIDVDYIGRDAFIHNKRATGRTRDLADIEELE